MYASNGGRPYEIGMYCVSAEKNLSQYEKRNDASIATTSEMTVSSGISKSCCRLCGISCQLSVISYQKISFNFTKHFLFNFLKNDMTDSNMSFLNSLCIV